VEEQGLAQVSDEGALAAVVDEVFAANPDIVEDWRNGDDKVKAKKQKALVGKIMQTLKGAANGQVVGRLADERLQGEPFRGVSPWGRCGRSCRRCGRRSRRASGR